MALSGKVALITGAASGIGFATAKEFIKQGIKAVTIVDSSSSGDEAAKNLLKERSDAEVLFMKTDVSDEGQVKNAFEKTVKKFGKLDIVINAAGIYDDTKWQLEVQVNLVGVIHCTLQGFEHMGTNKIGNGGIIVNISSCLGIRAMPVAPIYSATKFAVQGLSRCFGTQAYYGHTGVSVITVCPGITTTEMYNNIRTIVFDDKVVSAEALRTHIDEAGQQMPEDAAKGILRAVLDNENGAVWLVELGKVTKIDIIEKLRM